MKLLILHFILFSVFYINGLTLAEALLNYTTDGPGTFPTNLMDDAGMLFGEHTDDPDVYRNVSELITSKGYHVEEHTVQTHDGYLLTLLRIPHGRKGFREEKNKKVVLVLHGDASDSVQWVLDYPNESLGFILPDKGYDVWLLNNRGSKYSRKHIEFKTYENRFWNFSFQELGEYDAPATIDYILKETDKDGLYIVAHSRGTTQTFAMLSEMPDYNRKVKLFVAMAPATFLGHLTSAAVLALVPFADEIAFAINLATGGEVLPETKLSNRVRGEVCGVILPGLCENFLFAIGGADMAQVNQTRLKVYFTHFPSTTSIKSLQHYAQLVKSKKYRKFDYGYSTNLKYYHQKEPPDYNLSSITTPVALFWSSNDKLVDPRDVDILRSKLNSVVFDYLVPYPYTHFDYALAQNAHKILYKPVLQLLAEY